MNRVLRLQALATENPNGALQALDSTISAGLCSSISAGLCSSVSAGLCGDDEQIAN